MRSLTTGSCGDVTVWSSIDQVWLQACFHKHKALQCVKLASI